MSSFNRRNLILSLLATVPAVSGCGFTPTYAPEGAANALYGRVQVQSPSNRNTFLLVAELEREFGQTQTVEYELSVRLSIRTESVAVSEERVLRRLDLIGESTYALTDLRIGKTVSRGTVRGFTGYSTTASTVATRTAREDAEKRLMTILAQRIVARVTADVSTDPAAAL